LNLVDILATIPATFSQGVDQMTAQIAESNQDIRKGATDSAPVFTAGALSWCGSTSGQAPTGSCNYLDVQPNRNLLVTAG
jgi:hypothetical protein